MITIEKQTLIELVLRSEPDFLTQVELEMDSYGAVNNFNNESVWVWKKDRFKNMDEVELTALVLRIVEV